MTKINFKQFKLFLDIAHEKSNVIDVRKEVADSIYKNASGVAYLDLALRIYKSDGEIEFTDEEYALLEEFFTKNGTVMFIDSLRAQVYEQN